jgi:hypothetical protein
MASSRAETPSFGPFGCFAGSFLGSSDALASGFFSSSAGLPGSAAFGLSSETASLVGDFLASAGGCCAGGF